MRISRSISAARGPANLTTDRITAYEAARQVAKAANATINRELAALKRMFRLAEIAGKVAQRPYIPMLQEDNARKGFFEASEFRAVLRVAHQVRTPCAPRPGSCPRAGSDSWPGRSRTETP